MEFQKIFIEDATIPWTDLGGGVKRKIMGYNERVMLVKVAFEKNSIGTLHHHPHTQISFVESGSFEVEVDQTKKTLLKGDIFCVPPNAVHGVVCKEPGILIDIFSPTREDFITAF